VPRLFAVSALPVAEHLAYDPEDHSEAPLETQNTQWHTYAMAAAFQPKIIYCQ
jgi:hypothetical protein